MSGPAMPLHQPDDTGWIVYLVVMSVIVGGFLLWWAASGERRVRGITLPLLLLGGALSTGYEPFLDNVVLFWYPQDPDLTVIDAFGRQIPLAIPIGYAWFCGGLAYLTGRYFAGGITRRQFWYVAGAVAVVDFLAIGLTDWIGVAGFYGSGVLHVAGYPLWWAPFDVIIACGGGLLVMVLGPTLKGAARAYLIGVPILMVGFVGGVLGGPISTALNSQWSDAGIVAGAAVTIAFGLTILHVISRLVVWVPQVMPATKVWGAPASSPLPAATEPAVEADREPAIA